MRYLVSDACGLQVFKHHRLPGDIYIFLWINGEALELAGFLGFFCLVDFYFANHLVFIFSLLKKHLSLALGRAGGGS